MALLDERSSRVVPQVSQQSQDLVGDGAHLQGDIPLPAFQVLWSILARGLVSGVLKMIFIAQKFIPSTLLIATTVCTWTF